VCQRFLAETMRGSKAAHISRQHVPQRSFVSLFHKADFGSLPLLRRPLLSYIRSHVTCKLRMLLRCHFETL
jgi:hypothetical protein